MSSASELIKERSELLARVEQINAVLALLETPAKAVEIYTRRNLRNTAVSYRNGDGDNQEWKYVKVYSDQSLTKEASSYGHGGFITAEDAAMLQNDGQFDGGFIELV